MSEPTPSPDQSTKGSQTLAGFGPNEWLVDELYQQYLKDKDSVDRAWWDFFEDYRPTDATSAPANGGPSRQTAGSATRTPAASAPTGDGAASRADGPPPVQERQAVPAKPAPAAEKSPAQKQPAQPVARPLPRPA